MDIKVSKRAVLARVNRHLSHWDDGYGYVVKACRPTSRDYYTLGDWYEIGARVGGVTAKNIDLEAYARELGVLKSYEKMVE